LGGAGLLWLPLLEAVFDAGVVGRAGNVTPAARATAFTTVTTAFTTVATTFSNPPSRGKGLLHE